MRFWDSSAIVPLIVEETSSGACRSLLRWKAESTPGSSRVFLRALGTDDVVGCRGFIHVWRLEAVVNHRNDEILRKVFAHRWRA